MVQDFRNFDFKKLKHKEYHKTNADDRFDKKAVIRDYTNIKEVKEVKEGAPKKGYNSELEDKFNSSNKHSQRKKLLKKLLKRNQLRRVALQKDDATKKEKGGRELSIVKTIRFIIIIIILSNLFKLIIN